MEENQRQATFLSVAEVLASAAEQCLNAERNLRCTLYHVGEPHALALGEMAARERELAALLSGFVGEASENILETRLQYTLDSIDYPEPRDPFEAATRLVEVNGRIVDDLREQSRNVVPARVGEALDLLWRDVEAISRRISMIHVTMHDVGDA
jgi:hypothetical protein